MERAAAGVSRRNILVGAAGAAVCAIVATPFLRPVVGGPARRLLASNPITRRFAIGPLLYVFLRERYGLLVADEVNVD